MTTISIEELQRKLKSISADMLPVLKEAMTDATMNIEGKAKENCPVITGTLRRSIASKADIKGNEVHGIIHAGGEKANYAETVHEGTSKRPAQPFILDAIIEEENTTIEILSDAVESNLRGHTR